MTTIESTLRTDTARNYIGGRWVPSSTTGTSYSPATGEPLGTYYEADAEQVREAIRIAKDTFATHVWRRDRHLRAKVLEEMADRIEAASGELAMLLARENGRSCPRPTSSSASPRRSCATTPRRPSRIRAAAAAFATACTRCCCPSRSGSRA